MLPVYEGSIYTISVVISIQYINDHIAMFICHLHHHQVIHNFVLPVNPFQIVFVEQDRFELLVVEVRASQQIPIQLHRIIFVPAIRKVFRSCSYSWH